ncbi:hypothetical protein A2V49_03870 [candidate division WWE3 bacterium RBG_19FT_COMBO_34_6]|uniref:fructose-bisphosphate aldolase n=1 Tax=candidate division WWE3 bacterium RBG_19FT_COMBO_34_6 TaxID=1802612 RepID=A0A1F4UL71_UNCKA|nr:MAG: hypothetical protein A2V49_03870 [candidate division WWE3 bacterium RBG_19FT_COMBO_34_6]
MNNALYAVAKQIVTPHKGILASDERPSAADKNLEKAGIPSNEEIRRKYRELFINTPGIEQYLSGIIMHEETFYQSDSTGKLFRNILKEKNIISIIKLDEGLEELPNFPGEKISIGLDNLKKRAEKFYEDGAKAAKWRSVIKIGNDLPSPEVVHANSIILSTYALFCQQAGLVPIVEPEVLIDGDHTIQKSEEVTNKTLKDVFGTLKRYKVDLKAVVLKTSMVIPGNKCQVMASPEEIADATVRVLQATVPEEVPGIVFLSGGQSSEDATINLNFIAKKEPLPWEITFSYLRALEAPAIQVWQGKDENIQKARNIFMTRLRECVLADSGIYQK